VLNHDKSKYKLKAYKQDKKVGSLVTGEQTEARQALKPFH